MPKYSDYPATTTVTDDDLLLIMNSPAVSPAMQKVTFGSAKTNLSLVESSTQTASYTLVLADAGRAVVMNAAVANTLTVPPNSAVAFPVGTVVGWEQYGAGATTIATAPGVTVRSRGGALTSAGQYAAGSLRKIGVDEWLHAGDVV